MKFETRLGCWLIAASLIASCAAIAEDFAPGVQHVCVPNATHDGWDCGTLDNPPPAPAIQGEVSAEPVAAPPPFLMDPGLSAGASPYAAATPTTADEAEANADAQRNTASEEVSQSEPLAESAASGAAPLPESESVDVATESSSISPPTPVEIAADPEPEIESESAAIASEPLSPLYHQHPDRPRMTESASATSYAETAPTSQAPMAAESVESPTISMPTNDSSEPVAQETLPEPDQPQAQQTEAMATVSAASSIDTDTPPSTETTPASAATLSLGSLAGANEFAQLPAAQFTLQLAYSASAEAFTALIQQLGIDSQRCYVLRLKRDGGDWWVLAYGQFADVNLAKSALLQIRPVPGMKAVWPRRIGYLQAERQR